MTENIPNPIKKSRAPMIIIAVIAIIAVAGVIAFAVSGGFSSAPQSVIESDGPLGLVADGLVKTTDAQLEAQQNSFVYKALTGGSVEFVLGSKELISELTGTSFPGAALYAKLYSNADKMLFGLEAGVEVSDMKLVDALITLDKKALTVSSDSLLSSKVLGIGFENIAEHFNNSVFGPEGSYSLGVTAEDIIKGYNLNDFSGLMTEAEAFYAEYEAIYADFCNMLVTSLEENALIDETERGIVFDADEIAVTDVSVLLDDKSLPAVIEDVCLYFKDNQEFRSYLKDLLLIYEKMGMLEELELGSTADEAIMNLDDSLYSILNNLEDISEEMEGATVTFDFLISEKSGYFIGMEMTVANKIQENKLQFLIGPDPAAIEFFNLRMTQDEYELYEIEISVDDTKEKYQLDLLVEEAGEDEILSLALDHDKTSGEYQLKGMIEGDEHFALDGSVLEDGKRTVIRLDTAEFEGEELALDSQIVFREGDELKVGEYTDILLLSDEEFGVLLGEITGALMGLMFMMP